MQMSRIRRATVAVVATGFITLGLVTAPASATTPAAPTPTKYSIALGASLVTGTGATRGADYVDDLTAYASPLEPGLQTVNLGCGGETTATMLHISKCATKYTTGSQLGDAEAFLRAHPGQVAYVTLDIGGDDVLGCAAGGVIDQACFTKGLAQVESDLPQIVAGLRSAGGSVPIVGMTYYDPFLASWLQGAAGQQEAHQSVPLVRQLNDAMSAVYADYGVAVASAYKQFDTGDFTGTGTWQGATVPANVATICNWTWMCTPGGAGVHANDTGHAQLALAFEKVLVVPPTVSGSPPGGKVGQAYDFTFATSGIPAVHVHRSGALPRGLTLSRTGELSGTPSRAGTYAFTVLATDRKGGTASLPVTVTVAA